MTDGCCRCCFPVVLLDLTVAISHTLSMSCYVINYSRTSFHFLKINSQAAIAAAFIFDLYRQIGPGEISYCSARWSPASTELQTWAARVGV